MELIDNINKPLKEDLREQIQPGSKISIAASCFSIYAYQALKKELSKIDELRFIFTSPAFTSEKTSKEKREYYIPRLNRERQGHSGLYRNRGKGKLRVHSSPGVHNRGSGL